MKRRIMSAPLADAVAISNPPANGAPSHGASDSNDFAGLQPIRDVEKRPDPIANRAVGRGSPGLRTIVCKQSRAWRAVHYEAMTRLPAALLATLAFAANVHAQSAPPTAEARAIAREHYDKAVTHFNANEYSAAAEEFFAVYKAVPQPALLYNAAQAYRLGGDGAKALDEYRAFLKAQPEAKQKGDVEKKIKELEGKTPVVAVKVVPDMATANTSTLTSTSTSGSDRFKQIVEVIKENRAAFRACFDRWAKNHKGVDGKVTLTFYLDPDGNLDQPSADEKGFAAPDVAACIEELSRTLKYPKSPSGKFTRFSYPSTSRRPADVRRKKNDREQV